MGRTPQSLSAGLLSCLAGLLGAVSSPAHPLGNFTVNHFSRLQVAEKRIVIHYVIDMAEIPAFGELRKADSDEDGQTSPTELDAYLQRVAPHYAEGLTLVIDGVHASLPIAPIKAQALHGAGGLSTLRLEYEATAELPRHILPIGLTSRHRLEFDDTNDRDRIGWREIVVAPDVQVTVFDSSAFSNSVSNELRAYPPDMLADPLAESRATLSWTSGPAPEGATLLRTRNGKVVSVNARDRFAELISIPKLTVPLALLGLFIAALLGSAHALSPGHGKTIVGAYLVGSRGTPRHALFLGLTVTVTHTAGVFALGLLTLFASRYILPERLFPVLSFVSGALVAFLGITLLIRRLTLALGVDGAHLHGHSHTHVHFPGGTPHSHAPLESGVESLSWRSLLALGISGGLLPCPSALVVLLSAIGLNRVGYGLLLVLAFSAGLAATLTAIGLVFVYAGRWLSRFTSFPQASYLPRFLPVGSSLVVACLGLAISYSSAEQAGVHPVLLLTHLLASWQAVASGHTPLASMGGLAVLGFGLILGFKHATEADHVVAVSSIVSEHRNLSRVAIIGALWGAGHTVTLVLVGCFVLLLRVAIPEHFANILEFGVALMIIGLSGNALARAMRRRNDIRVYRHFHARSEHTHLHSHDESPDAHLSLDHEVHHVSRVGLKPLLVGAMHGLAGSAALTLLVLTQVSSITLGLSYLLIFGIGSILGMMAVSILIGLPFALSARHLGSATRRLQAIAGTVGVGFGFWYAFSVGSTVF